MLKTMNASEIETRNTLEKILRQCVEDVKTEIAKKRSENKSIYYAKGRKGRLELEEEKNLTH
jgi:N-acetylmuramic acid 6-phosphate (MurNAc-6-P) etherase